MSSKIKILLAVILVLLIAAALIAFSKMYIVTGGKATPVNSRYVDLSGRDGVSVGKLVKLSQPEEIDLRGCAVTVEDYALLRDGFPGCLIRWDVPLSCGRYENTSERISINGFLPSDLALYSYFTDLREIDAGGAGLSVDDFYSLKALLPECSINTNISVSGGEYAIRSESISLSGADISAEDLKRIIPAFSELKVIDLSAIRFSPDEQAELIEMFPGLTFIWDVRLGEDCFRSISTSLDFGGADDPAVGDALRYGFLFPFVTEIDIPGSPLDAGMILKLRDSFNGAFVRCNTEVFGQTVPTDSEELDLSGISISDLALFDTLAQIMPDLKKVVMCDCGVGDEEMDALNRRFEDIRFVWKVYFGIYSLRTDATYFCASDVPERNYIGVNMTDSQIAPLRYCTDLVALDIGHMTLTTDLSILRDMHDLRFLIISTSGMKGDISVLSGLKELYYLEIFHNTINDLSPLLECKKLEHLNIGYCTGYDIAPLLEMKQLKRLWIPGNSLTDTQKASLQEALPDTLIYMPRWDESGSTGGGWRDDEAYYEMRDILHMHYIRGDAGYHLNDNG